MAPIVLTIGGAVLGHMLLPGIGSAIGGAIDGYVGGLVDQQLFGPRTDRPKREDSMAAPRSRVTTQPPLGDEAIYRRLEVRREPLGKGFKNRTRLTRVERPSPCRAAGASRAREMSLGAAGFPAV